MLHLHILHNYSLSLQLTDFLWLNDKVLLTCSKDGKLIQQLFSDAKKPVEKAVSLHNVYIQHAYVAAWAIRKILNVQCLQCGSYHESYRKFGPILAYNNAHNVFTSLSYPFQSPVGLSFRPDGVLAHACSESLAYKTTAHYKWVFIYTNTQSLVRLPTL